MLTEGTEVNPYKITTAEDFSLVLKFPDGYFELESDINFKDIPVLHNKDYCFGGSFNGKGHKIANLVVRNVRGGLSGIFGSIAKEGVVQNLTFNNAFVTGEGCVGIIAGANWGKVINCHIKNSVAEGYYNVGGLIGVNCRGAKVVLCSAEATLIGNVNIGGIIGKNKDGGKVYLCQSLGSLCGIENIGGIAGQNCGEIIDSESFVKLGGKKAYGQLVGLNRGVISADDNELIQKYCNRVFVFTEYIGRNCLAF